MLDGNATGFDKESQPHHARNHTGTKARNHTGKHTQSPRKAVSRINGKTAQQVNTK
jgi:hypothetical protein